jgi:hydroxymethylpyrimidine pyrophosphatase-like HAD family hydrolase
MSRNNGSMRFLALATDYDGTLATHGRVDGLVLPALKQLRDSGRKLLLVTGRQLRDLQEVFPETRMFDRVVAENGALLYRPSSHQEVTLCGPPDPRLLAALRGRGVPFSTGRTIIASDDAHHTAVAAAIHELDLAAEVHIELNKGSLMVLPSGVDKRTGLQAALAELQLAPANVVAIGDAENDASLLAACGCAAAVANALPSIKRNADLVTAAGHGAGVAELIGQLLDNDLARCALRHTRG